MSEQTIKAVTREAPAARAATTSLRLKTGVTVVWGIPDARKHADLGVVQSVRVGSTGKEKTYPGEDGDTAAVVYYDLGTTLTLEILAKTAAAVPVRGDVLTHNASEKYLVESAESNWQAEDVQKITCTCKAWTNISLA